MQIEAVFNVVALVYGRSGHIGLADYCVDIDRFDSDLLLRRFSLLVRNGESIKGVMAETLDGYKRKLASQFDDLFPRGTPAPSCGVN